MQRVKQLAFFKKIKEIREYQFGTFYFFDGLVISEINEGVTFGWEMAKKAIDAAHEIFGEDMPIAYISNRVNNYHVVPADWVKFYSHRHQLDFYCVVGNTKGSFASLVLERVFFRNSIRQFSELDKAVEWSLGKIKSKKSNLASPVG
ncbi:hypothetical protein [Flagellimonas meishanensis]|uniref:hypothetical protein n=1 Tax=Flagellimonas meishanensis TaxID=2873264 RepID=UPI001CA65CE3|nr:hypothetical protein [[Muricauda] meishanensis]